MTEHPSTLRPGNGSTLGKAPHAGELTTLERLVAQEWEEQQAADLVGAIERHPEVLLNRSVLLNLALREYRSIRSASAPLELGPHCERFRRFGPSVEQSIFRQLETQQYLDEHPELLDYLAVTVWPEVGEEFGNFKLKEQLGSGGSARVYLATQGDLGDRLVVIKATPYCSFEASILGRLNHPHIVPIHFAGEVEEHQLSFLCMPYCGRSTLVDLLDLAFAQGLPTRADVIRQASIRWLPEAEQELVGFRMRSRKPGPPTYVGAILKMALRIADALDHAHQRGIFHGDLKPSNVLLTPAGDPLLLDFNLSRDESTGGALCGGTLAYMPPEQLRVIAQEQAPIDIPPAAGASSDIYSFGALLYELFAGHPPLKLDNSREVPDVAARHLLEQLKRPIAPIRELHPAISNNLATLIMQCLALDPNERPKSIGEVKRRLAAEGHWLGEVRRVTRLHPKLVGTMLLLLLTGAVAATTWLASRPPAHVALYEQGLSAARESDWLSAEHSFLKAIQLQPDYDAARLELGRAYIAANQLDLALSTLQHLSYQRHENPQLMELVGYVYTLKMMPSAAIAWYERSLEHGGNSISLYNNLAASYLSGVPRVSMNVRLALQSQYLDKARAIDSASLAVRVNTVRHQLALAANDLAYDHQQIEELVSQLESHHEANSAVARLVNLWREPSRPYRSQTEHVGTKSAKTISLSLPTAKDQRFALQYDTTHVNDVQTFFIKPLLAP